MSTRITNVKSPPRLYLLLENPQKSNNLGPILRCAAAFGVSQVVAVGFDKCATQGSHGAAKHVSLVAFPTVDQAVSFLRNEKDCKSLVGLLGGAPNTHDEGGYTVVEENETLFVSQAKANDETSMKRSYPIHTRPFMDGNCCFVICKNPKGLPSCFGRQCDLFVHVPHVDVENNTSSWFIDAPSCLSIALHHYTAWAQCSERGFKGHKYEVGTTQQRSKEERQAIRLARAKAREQSRRDENGVDTAVNLFGEEEPSGGDY